MATLKTDTGLEMEAHFSIRDVYTASDGELVIRFENRDGRLSLTLAQDELPMIKQGLLDNQRLRPDQGYKEGFVTDAAGPGENKMMFYDGSIANTDPHTGIPLPEGIEK